MPLSYSFRSLEELAAYLDGKAVDIRASTSNIQRGTKAKRAQEVNIRLGEAFAHQQIADILRNSKIEER